jgi:hypothetical protein
MKAMPCEETLSAAYITVIPIPMYCSIVGRGLCENVTSRLEL